MIVSHRDPAMRVYTLTRWWGKRWCDRIEQVSNWDRLVDDDYWSEIHDMLVDAELIDR